MTDKQWKFDNMQMKYLHKQVPISVAWPSDAPELQGDAPSLSAVSSPSRRATHACATSCTTIEKMRTGRMLKKIMAGRYPWG